MGDFKFFQRNAVVTSTPSEHSSLHRLTINNHPDTMFGDGEMNVVFFWGSGDNIRDDYDLVTFRGSVCNFANAYEIRREWHDDNQYLPKVPRIETLTYGDDNNFTYRSWNHEFQDPNQIVEITYKIYKR